MKATNRFWRYLLLPLSFAGMLSISSAAELNPAAVIYKLPDQIPWGPVNAAGAQVAVVVGDPTKPGFYVGGTIYSDWASVPENYKMSNSDRPDPSRSTASIFRFTW